MTDVNAQIQLWRQKAAAGELSQEDCRGIIQALRSDRARAAGTSAASKKKKSDTAAKKAPIDSDDLLGQLDLL